MQLVGESVAAVSGTQWNYDFLAFPGNRPNWVPKWGFKTEAPTFDPRFDIGGQFGGWHYGVKAYGGYGGDVGSDGEAKRGPDVNGYCDFAGVLGTGIFVTSVAGTSVNNIGVYGQVEENIPLQTGFQAGVLGAGLNQPGVIGWSQNSYGLRGISFNGSGIRTETFNGWAVEAISQNAVAIWGAAPVYGVWAQTSNQGPAIPSPFNYQAGVWGSSAEYIGTAGTSDRSPGIYGYSTSNAGVVGQSANPNSFGGYFFGNVHIAGTVSYGFTAAVVTFSDGTQRVLHGMESPEHWLEDFGTARLKRGRAVVKIDPNFAKVITRRDYRVFLTPEGDCRGLYLRRKRATSFDVCELGGGKSGVPFSYRVVGRRKDIRSHKRFAKIDTRLSVPVTGTRAPRKRAPTAVELRAFLSRLQKTRARTQTQKSAKPGRRLHALRKR